MKEMYENTHGWDAYSVMHDKAMCDEKYQQETLLPVLLQVLKEQGHVALYRCAELSNEPWEAFDIYYDIAVEKGLIDKVGLSM